MRDTGEGGFVAFEWIREENYLGECGARTRGANVTSLDALMRVTLEDGMPLFLLFEWKYLEHYGAKSIAVSEGRTNRVDTYRGS